MSNTLLSNLTMLTLLSVLFVALIFIAFFTRSWGVNWLTWLLGKPTGSMRGGCLLIIFIIVDRWLYFRLYCLGFNFKNYCCNGLYG